MEDKEIRLNEKAISEEQFQEIQKSLEGQKDVKIVQTGKDEYRTKIQD